MLEPLQMLLLILRNIQNKNEYENIPPVCDSSSLLSKSKSYFEQKIQKATGASYFFIVMQIKSHFSIPSCSTYSTVTHWGPGDKSYL